LPKRAAPQLDRKAPSCRAIVLGVIRTQATHSVVIDGTEVAQGIFYPEIIEATQGRMAASSVRFALGTLFHRGVIDKMMLRSEVVWTGVSSRVRPPTIYWAKSEPIEEDLLPIPGGINSSVRGQRRSSYHPDGPQGLSYARNIYYPGWSRSRRPKALQAAAREPEIARRAFPWAVEDGSEEDRSLDWFDAKGNPFATSVHRNPFGHGHPDDLRAVRWLVNRMDTKGYGGPGYEYTKKMRNDRRRARTGK
jgi:hypothetical protein